MDEFEKAFAELSLHDKTNLTKTLMPAGKKPTPMSILRYRQQVRRLFYKRGLTDKKGEFIVREEVEDSVDTASKED